jgi:hypothetical protein
VSKDQYTGRQGFESDFHGLGVLKFVDLDLILINNELVSAQ